MQESERVHGWRISVSLSCEYVTRKSMHTTKALCKFPPLFEREIKRQLSLALDKYTIQIYTDLPICSESEVIFSKIRIIAIAVKLLLSFSHNLMLLLPVHIVFSLEETLNRKYSESIIMHRKFSLFFYFSYLQSVADT